MTKEEFIERLQEILPDHSTILFSEVTVLTKDYVTLIYDTETDSLQ